MLPPVCVVWEALTGHLGSGRGLLPDIALHASTSEALNVCTVLSKVRETSSHLLIFSIRLFRFLLHGAPYPFHVVGTCNLFFPR